MAKENLNQVRADLIAKGVLQGTPVRSNFHGRAVNKGVSQLNAVLARRASFHSIQSK